MNDFNMKSNPIVDNLYDGIVSGSRASLARGITLVESTNPKKKAMGRLMHSLLFIYRYLLDLHVLCSIVSGQALLSKVLRYTKELELAQDKFTFRIGKLKL